MSPTAGARVQRPLGGTITVAGYPLPMVLAERITTAVNAAPPTPGAATSPTSTLLTRHHPIGGDLDRCMSEVATYRQATLEPLSTILDGDGAAAP